MTTITLKVASTIVLPDGRTALVLDGPVSPAIAREAVKSAAPVQRTPKPKARKARTPLSGEALAKQVAFWSGKASKGQLARLKEAGTKMRPATLAKLTSMEARAELSKLNPGAKVAVIPAEVLAAMKA